MRNLAFGTLLLFTGAAEAGTAKVVEYEQSETLYLTGDVDYNMVADVWLYLPTVKPNDYGLRVVLLNSPGGFVDAAFEISQIFDGLGVHTVIPNGASCMSSCASIIFNAGDYRTVAPEGVFGQHSCAVGDVPDDECNQVVGDHAFAHGVSHGAMSAFMIQVAPEDMMRFRRSDVDGWGISRYLGTVEGGSDKSEPMLWKILQGQYPPSQAAWRLDFKDGGFKAFMRPMYDHIADMQLNVYCIEDYPGQLFVSVYMLHPADDLKAMVDFGVLMVDGETVRAYQRSDRLATRAFEPPQLSWSTVMFRETEDQRWRTSEPNRKRSSASFGKSRCLLARECRELMRSARSV